MSMLDAITSGFQSWMQSRPHPPEVTYLGNPGKPEKIPDDALADPDSAFPLIWRQVQSIARVLPRSLSTCIFNKFVLLKDPQKILEYRVIEDASYQAPCCADCAAILPYVCIALSSQALEMIERLCAERQDFDVRSLFGKPVSPFSMITQPWIRQADQIMALDPLPRAMTREDWMAARMDALFSVPTLASSVRLEEGDEEQEANFLAEDSSSLASPALDQALQRAEEDIHNMLDGLPASPAQAEREALAEREKDGASSEEPSNPQVGEQDNALAGLEDSGPPGVPEAVESREDLLLQRDDPIRVEKDAAPEASLVQGESPSSRTDGQDLADPGASFNPPLPAEPSATSESAAIMNPPEKR